MPYDYSATTEAMALLYHLVILVFFFLTKLVSYISYIYTLTEKLECSLRLDSFSHVFCSINEENKIVSIIL